MFDYSGNELKAIDEALEPKLAWAEQKLPEAEQLALDATRLLSCTENRLNEYADKGFFKRALYQLGGKSGDIMRTNQADLLSMQKAAWRYISLLQERDLMMAHSILTIKNNLLTLAVDQDDIKKQITIMADKVLERFLELEDRMKKVEVSSKIHSWLLTLDTYDYDEKYPPFFRLLRIVGEFGSIKGEDWNVQEIKYLQKAIKEVDLPWKKKIRIDEFVDGLVDEIDCRVFDEYYTLLTMSYNNFGVNVPPLFILDNIPVPSYMALYHIADDYTRSSATIDVLAEQLNLSKKDAIKKVLKTFISKQGIDLGVPIPLRDLGVELLTCSGLARRLFQPAENIAVSQKKVVRPQPKSSLPGALQEEKAEEDSDEKSLLAKAEAGDAEAQLQLSKLYDEQERHDESFKWAECSAMKGNLEAQFAIGKCYSSGKGTPKDKTKAFECYMKAAENGYAEGQVKVGDCYFFGFDRVTKDEAKGFEWLMKAAENGADEGMVKVGYCYRYGMGGVTENKAKAFEWYMKAAENGSAEGMVLVGQCYFNGWGVHEDEAKAFEWYMKAAENGSAEGMVTVGKCYDYGRGVTENKAKAFEWYMKAAENGSAEGMVLVGLCYQVGWGVHEDLGKAFEYYQKAADLDFAEGFFWLGLMYFRGLYVEIDYSKAIANFEIASSKKHKNSFIRLAEAHFFGLGVAYDPSKAKNILLLAITEANYDINDLLKDFLQNIISNISDNSCFYKYDDVPPDKRSNASETFLRPFLSRGEEYIIFYDDTFWGSAKNGFAIGPSLVSWQNNDERLVEKPLVWTGFKDARVVGNRVVFDTQNSILMGQTPEKNRNYVSALLKILYAIATYSK
jgi:TPR repeat protein